MPTDPPAYSYRDLGDGHPVKVQHCSKCGVAPASVDDCGESGNPDCPYFGIGREEYEKRNTTTDRDALFSVGQWVRVVNWCNKPWVEGPIVSLGTKTSDKIKVRVMRGSTFHVGRVFPMPRENASPLNSETT